MSSNVVTELEALFTTWCPQVPELPHTSASYSGPDATENESQYACVECNSQFKTRASLMNHLRNYCSRQPGNRHKCPNCDSSYKNYHSLVEHLRYDCGKEPGFRHVCSKSVPHTCHESDSMWTPLRQASATNVLTPATPPDVIPTSVHSLPDIPWDRFPENFVLDCQAGKIPTPGDRREVVKIIGRYLVWEVQTVVRSVVEGFARAIVAKYPAVGDRVGNQILGKGHESLFSQLYNKVLFEKRLRKNRSLGSAVNVDPILLEKKQQKRERQCDKYGCVAWQPDALPPGESTVTQEEKRLWLFTKCEPCLYSDTELVRKVMGETYVSQRYQINNKDTVEKITAEWPLLKQTVHIADHFSTLVGFNTREVWMEALEAKAQPIINYMNNVKGQKKEKILEFIIPMKIARTNGNSELPILEAVIPVISSYFGDTFAFQLFKANETEEEVLERVHVNHPLLAIVGSSLHAHDVRCYVVVEKRLLTEPPTVLDGFFAMFSSYFVFNIAYPECCTSTLEFIQRVFLGINPLSGHKRGGKRKKTTCDSKVSKLISNLTEYTSVFNTNK